MPSFANKVMRLDPMMSSSCLQSLVLWPIREPRQTHARSVPGAALGVQVGVHLSKELMAIAGYSLKANITTLGPLVLPVSEQLTFLAYLFARKVRPHSLQRTRRSKLFKHLAAS